MNPKMMSKTLSQSFYLTDPAQVAQGLLGKFLFRGSPQGITQGKIVETEAYYGKGDPGSHAFRGKTPRSSIMWGKPGIAYVYFTYGRHYLFNVVVEKEGIPGAVLIRAVEPLEGIELMRKRRNVDRLKDLTRGPARLTQAFDITIEENGIDLTQGNLLIKEGQEERFSIVTTTRIGIKKGEELPLRFYIKGNRFVSH